jgi:hypothetical protein
MESIFIFVVTVFLAVGITEEVVVPAANKAVEVATPIVDTVIEKGTEVYDSGKELITGTETE